MRSAKFVRKAMAAGFFGDLWNGAKGAVAAVGNVVKDVWQEHGDEIKQLAFDAAKQMAKQAAQQAIKGAVGADGGTGASAGAGASRCWTTATTSRKGATRRACLGRRACSARSARRRAACMGRTGRTVTTGKRQTPRACLAWSARRRGRVLRGVGSTNGWGAGTSGNLPEQDNGAQAKASFYVRDTGSSKRIRPNRGTDPGLLGGTLVSQATLSGILGKLASAAQVEKPKKTSSVQIGNTNVAVYDLAALKDWLGIDNMEVYLITNQAELTAYAQKLNQYGWGHSRLTQFVRRSAGRTLLP